MSERLKAHFKRRESQAILSEGIYRNLKKLDDISDEELRHFNRYSTSESQPLDLEVKNGVTFGEVYRYAIEHYQRTCRKNASQAENLLNEKINQEGHTLLWSGGTLAEHIAYRRMTQKQYNCCAKVADKILSERN